ncbi:MAG: EAL domain-containing protein [Peptococcaceae bacterium]|nr:EAL domain-containing protein [Peptococcaceae bacterium]
MPPFDFKQQLEFSPLPVFIYQNGKVRKINQYMHDFIGYSEDEIIKIDFFELIHPKDRYLVAEAELYRLVADSEQAPFEIRLIKVTGDIAYVKSRCSYLNFKGKPAVLFQIYDITKEKASLELLKESEIKFRKLFHNNKDVMAIISLDESGDFSKHLEVNAACCRVTGYSRSELLLMTPEDIFSKEQQGTLKLIQGELRDKKNITFETEWLSKKGTKVPLEISCKLFYLNEQQVVLAVGHNLTALKPQTDNIKTGEDKFKAVFESTRMGLAVLDLSPKKCPAVIEQNAALQKMLGFSLEELEEKKILLFCDSRQQGKSEKCSKNYYYAVSESSQGIQTQKAITTKFGKRVWANITISMMTGADFDRLGLVMVEDITENRNMQKQLFSAHRRLHEIIEFLPDATFAVDITGKVTFWNQAMEKMSGVSKEKVLGEHHIPCFVCFHGDLNISLVDLIISGDSNAADKYLNVKKEGDTYFTEFYSPAIFNGKGAHIWAKASPLYDNNGNLVGAVESLRDISDRKQMEEQMSHLATHDFLTGISNRYYFEKVLKNVVARAKRGTESSLLVIDIDNFKLVNDTIGHQAGDEALIHIANILSANIREVDLLTRLGGDEFAVLLEGASVDDAVVVAEKLRNLVDESDLFLTEYRVQYNLSISIGLVAIKGDFEAEKLFSMADNALYTAKEKGRNRVFVAKPWQDVSEKLSEDNKTIILIKKSIKEHNFVFLYQPIVDMTNFKTIHYEALTRLVDKGGLVSPDVFIPVAERYGLMPSLDRIIIKNAIKTLSANPPVNIFVNISGLSMGDESLLRFIESSIKKSKIDPARLGFEITETFVVKDLKLAKYWIDRLKKLGCQFALDDFGKGFTSFSYLKELPVNYIKIDGSFIRSLKSEASNIALVKAMNSVANALGKRTVAESVENEEIKQILVGLKIDCAQGYHFGRPMEGEKIGFNMEL